MKGKLMMTFGLFLVIVGVLSISNVVPLTIFPTGKLDNGHIIKYGSTYPPENFLGSVRGGVTYVGQSNQAPFTDSGYVLYRGYISFDTSTLGEGSITSITLRLKTYADYSDTDFDVIIMGGAQPLWGEELLSDDWGCGTVELARWNTRNYPGDGSYISISLPVTTEINRQGKTQFELKSSREGTAPTTNEVVQFSPPFELEIIVEETQFTDVTEYNEPTIKQEQTVDSTPSGQQTFQPSPKSLFPSIPQNILFGLFFVLFGVVLLGFGTYVDRTES
jgi:hypothetical protein